MGSEAQSHRGPARLQRPRLRVIPPKGWGSWRAQPPRPGGEGCPRRLVPWHDWTAVQVDTGVFRSVGGRRQVHRCRDWLSDFNLQAMAGPQECLLWNQHCLSHHVCSPSEHFKSQQELCEAALNIQIHEEPQEAALSWQDGRVGCEPWMAGSEATALPTKPHKFSKGILGHHPACQLLREGKLSGHFRDPRAACLAKGHSPGPPVPGALRAHCDLQHRLSFSGSALGRVSSQERFSAAANECPLHFPGKAASSPSAS